MTTTAQEVDTVPPEHDNGATHWPQSTSVSADLGEAPGKEKET